jgi:hypothetical protein
MSTRQASLLFLYCPGGTSLIWMMDSSWPLVKRRVRGQAIIQPTVITFCQEHKDTTGILLGRRNHMTVGPPFLWDVGWKVDDTRDYSRRLIWTHLSWEQGWRIPWKVGSGKVLNERRLIPSAHHELTFDCQEKMSRKERNQSPFI